MGYHDHPAFEPDDPKPTLHIMRGIPGSGKTTGAKSLGCTMIAADDFHTDEVTGEYMFDPKRAAQAHAWCLENAVVFMKKKRQDLCIHNTAIHNWEYATYVEVGLLAGYDIQIHEYLARTRKDVRICAGRQQHQVPVDVILRMWYEFEQHWDPTHNIVTHKIEG